MNHKKANGVETTLFRTIPAVTYQDESQSKNTCRGSLRAGFTLIEVLVVVFIVGTLAAVSLPIYTRAIERSRATEAMTNIKAINDAIYAYYSMKEKCPTKFNQLIVTLSPDPTATNTSLASGTVDTKFFTFSLSSTQTAAVPGTKNACPGVLAKRREGGDYQYGIYNPYTTVAGQAAALVCAPLSGISAKSKSKSQEICESLGMYDTAVKQEI